MLGSQHQVFQTTYFMVIVKTLDDKGTCVSFFFWELLNLQWAKQGQVSDNTFILLSMNPCSFVSHSFAEQTSERRAVSDGSVSAGLAVRPGTAGSGANGKRNRRGRSQRPERRSRRRGKRVQLRTRHSGDEQKRQTPVRRLSRHCSDYLQALYRAIIDWKLLRFASHRSFPLRRSGVPRNIQREGT